MGATSTSRTIEIWGDIGCPWCYLNSHRIRRAIELAGVDAEVVYRAYELSPQAPTVAEKTTAEYLVTERGREPEYIEATRAKVRAVGEEYGLVYNLEGTLHTSSRAAHEALKFAADQGKQSELLDRLYRAHFEENRDFGAPAAVADLAVEVGLDRDELLTALESGVHADAVTADIARASSLGVTGVPFLLIDGVHEVRGARDEHALADALRAAELAALVDADGELCAPDGCVLPTPAGVADA